MNNIKKAGIITGATIGGIIGGTISVVGKVSKNKFIDELGESVIDSTILTGSIAGTVASGASHIVAGKIRKNPIETKEGTNDLKDATNEIVGNFVTNINTVVSNGSEIIDGVKKRDKKKVVKSTKTLIKVIAVGAITVGAVKVDEEKDDIN
ncbi:hypothetical protein [Anaerovorax odorimutans]|uniref:hypothetical protein n=1 Tax=Anaerovorax odorimutans TaxID=109327 RepID=UPI000488268D|nr:hypothetical protein [Anaerovorax odorimutans]